MSMTRELKQRRNKDREPLRTGLEVLFPGDEASQLSVLQATLASGERTIANDTGLSIFAQALLGGTESLDGLLLRSARCDDVTGLALSDPTSASSVNRALQRTHEGLWPVEHGVYSDERCKDCNNKSIYHISAQVACADEETSFFTICAFCNSN